MLNFSFVAFGCAFLHPEKPGANARRLIRLLIVSCVRLGLKKKDSPMGESLRFQA